MLGKEIYELIMDNLSDWEIQRPNFIELVLNSNFYKQNINKHNKGNSFVKSHSVVNFLLNQLIDNWNNTITETDLTKWLELAKDVIILEYNKSKTKYLGLIEQLSDKNI